MILDENEIITKYNDGYGIEKLCSEYKVGKLKIKDILSKNNVEIRKKGMPVRNIEVPFNVDINNKIIECKCCGKTFNDVENKSGSTTEHMKICYPDVIIPSKLSRATYKKTNGTLWHLQYFNLIDKEYSEKLSCPECDWFTYDLTNKTGALTKHIEKEHGSINDFIEKYDNLKSLFNVFTKNENRLKELDEDSVTCQICGEKMKYVTDTHLFYKHNITYEEYNEKYPNLSRISGNINITYNPKSKAHLEIEEFLNSYNIEFKSCDRKILNGLELDIFLPEYNVAIEYNGLYWHSEKQGKNKFYHLEKTKKCLEKNIHLIHIFEDEWNDKKNIIKNRLINLLNINNSKIYARKCDIVTLNKDEKNKFLTENHLQGNDKSQIYLGLKYNNEIVSVITFGQERIVLGNKKKIDKNYELYRFCSKNVIGGFSKLFKHFIKTYEPEKIITYADRNWSPSNKHCFYEKVGFDYIKETKPNYYYLLKYNKREHRFNYRKSILVKNGADNNKTEMEIMLAKGYDIIWDTGNLKFEYKKK